MSQECHRLPDHHGWQAPPGHVVAAIDRGAVRFNVPESWVFVPGPDVLTIHDAHPPDDNCRLGASYLKLPSGVDWAGLPLEGQLSAAMAADSERVLRGQPVRVERAGFEIAWAEYHFEDPNEHRPARSRVAVARGSDIQALITLDYWQEHAERMDTVWSEVIRSLELGRYVDDLTLGDTDR